MINLQAILIANGSAVVMLLVLIFSCRRTIRNRLPDNIMFYIMVGAAMIQCITESLTFLVDGNTAPGMRSLSIILNTLLYIINILFTFTWTTFCDYKLFSDMERIKKRYALLSIPCLAIVIGAILNIFTPVYFTISDANVYQRTNLFIIPFVVSYFYLAYGVALIYRHRNSGKSYLFMPAVLFMIPIIIGSILQYLFYGISLVHLGSAIALVSVYINVQNEVSYIDMLSGLYNRQYISGYLGLMAKKTPEDRLVAGIMLDIDSFKSINDRFGHITGDDAIKTAGVLLRSCLPPKAIAVRYAGDEFIILGAFQSMDEVRALLARISESTDNLNKAGKKPYSISFSVGFSELDRQSDTLDSFIDRIDSFMYADKNTKKTAMLRLEPELSAEHKI